MANDPNGNIFIGYRRDCSLWQAYAIYFALSELHNREVYIDLENEGPGDWKEGLYSLIDSSTHYVLILTPNTFEEKKEDDVLLWEITTAFKLDLNIVHLWFDGFSWKKHKYHLEENFEKKLKRLQGHIISNHNFRGDIQKVNEKLLVKRDDIHPKPISPDDQDRILSHAAGTAITNNLQILEPVSHVSRGRVDVYSLSEKLLSGARPTINSNIDFLGKLAKEHSEREIRKLTSIIPDVAEFINEIDYFNNTAKFIGLSPVESTQWLSKTYLPGLISSMDAAEFDEVNSDIETDVDEIEIPPEIDARYNDLEDE